MYPPALWSELSSESLHPTDSPAQTRELDFFILLFDEHSGTRGGRPRGARDEYHLDGMIDSAARPLGPFRLI